MLIEIIDIDKTDLSHPIAVVRMDGMHRPFRIEAEYLTHAAGVHALAIGDKLA
jgi:hypothetical protein